MKTLFRVFRANEMKIFLFLSCIILSGATIIPKAQLAALLRMLMGTSSLSSFLTLGNNGDKFDWLLPYTDFDINNQTGSYTNVCIFSRNPLEYQPKCFRCPNAAYESILKACEGSESAPNKFTFTQAQCMEVNCGINYPVDGNIASVRVRRQISRQSKPQKSEVNYVDGNSTQNSEEEKSAYEEINPLVSRKGFRLINLQKQVTPPPAQYNNLPLRASNAIKTLSGTKIFFLVSKDTPVSE
ncbi:uncharacterized protein [Parasteatoda tepidariorum]|uniref:uncharacterized protein isoform X3 n=1 Tax=Parasteatoda tepidariorum TaxID=114398 RepID=UPI001C7287EE|nr:uncharacterized protein LOC107456699 isoform X4 [Parasteatoda tepidariorum]